MTEAELLLPDAFDALTDEWQTTTEIADGLRISWEPGGHQLRPLRYALYALMLNDLAEVDPGKRLKWRRVHDAA